MNRIYLSLIIGCCTIGAFAAGTFVNTAFPYALAVGVLCVGMAYSLINLLHSKKADDEAALHEELFFDALNAAGIACYRIDLEGRIVAFSGAESVLPECMDSANEDVRNLILPSTDGFEVNGAVYKSLRAGNISSSFEVQYDSKQFGKGKLVHTVVLARDRKGRPSGCIGIVQNVSKVEFLESELDKERRYLDSVMNNSTDSIFIQDFNGCFLKVNNVFAGYAGVSNPSACVGLSVYNFLSPQVAETVLKDIRTVVEQRTETRLTLPANDSQGNKIRFDVRHCLHVDGNGRPSAIVGFARELNEDDVGKNVQLPLGREFQDSLSHELRTPVAGMLGSLKVLEGEEMSSSAREYVAKCVLSAQRLKKAVNNFIYDVTGQDGAEKPLEKTTDSSDEDDSIVDTEVGLNVLLAEDDISSQVFMRRILEQWGCNVRTAANGTEVLRFLEEQSCDLVLMDIHMPEMSGYEAIARIRETEPAGKAMPIIVMSAYGADSDYKKMRELGVSEFIAKPVRSHVLKAAMDRIFD